MAVSQVGTPAALASATVGSITGSWDASQPRNFGDLLVASVTAYGSTSSTSILGPAGWTEVAEAAGNNRARSAVFWAVAAGGDAAPTFTSTLSGTKQMSCELYELAGAAAARPVDSFGTVSGTVSSTTETLTGNHVAGPGEYAVAAWSMGGGTAGTVTWTPGAGWTNAAVDGRSAAQHCAHDILAGPPFAHPYQMGSAADTAASVTRSMPVTVASSAGDTLLVTVCCSNMTVSSVTDSQNNVYILDASSASDPDTYFYRCPGATGGAGGGVPSAALGTADTLIVTVSATSSLCDMQMLCAPGVGPLDAQSATTSGSGATTATVTATPGQDGDWAVLGWGNSTLPSFAASVPYTLNGPAGPGPFSTMGYASLGMLTAGNPQSVTGNFASGSYRAKLWLLAPFAETGTISTAQVSWAGIVVVFSAAVPPPPQPSQVAPVWRAHFARPVPKKPTFDAFWPQAAVALQVPDGDAGTGTDAGESVAAALSDADACAGADSGITAGVTPVSPETGAGTDTTGTAGLSDTDAGTGTDVTGTVRLSSGDTGTGTGAGESNGNVFVQSTVPAITLQPSAAWLSRWRPGRPRRLVLPLFVPLVPPPSDTDGAHGEDSGFAFPVTSETTGPAADGGEAITVTDPDASFSADTELTAWPNSADRGGTSFPLRDAGEGEYWTGPLADLVPDTGHGTDGPTPVIFFMADTEACAGTDGHIIDVYSFQPPFRFTGGQYELRIPHPRPQYDGARELVLWRGERPEGTAYRLYAAFAEGRLHFVSATDEASAREEEGDVASLTVTVHVAAALSVRAEAG